MTSQLLWSLILVQMMMGLFAAHRALGHAATAGSTG
jgi:hypothetical protein